MQQDSTAGMSCQLLLLLSLCCLTYVFVPMGAAAGAYQGQGWGCATVRTQVMSIACTSSTSSSLQSLMVVNRCLHGHVHTCMCVRRCVRACVRVYVCTHIFVYVCHYCTYEGVLYV